MKNQKRQYDDDDGRVIVSMDVGGMPRRPKRETNAALPKQASQPLSRSEARRFTANALLAVLVIGAVFSATWILFTLFLTKILFR